MKRITVDGLDLVPDFTGGKPEYVDEAGREWITPDTLAQRFRALCDQTGMTCGALAAFAGVSQQTLSNYRSGVTCCPRAVWRLVESRKM